MQNPSGFRRPTKTNARQKKDIKRFAREIHDIPLQTACYDAASYLLLPHIRLAYISIPTRKAPLVNTPKLENSILQDYTTVEAFAAEFGTCQPTVRRWISNYGLPAISRRPQTANSRPACS